MLIFIQIFSTLKNGAFQIFLLVYKKLNRIPLIFDSE